MTLSRQKEGGLYVHFQTNTNKTPPIVNCHLANLKAKATRRQRWEVGGVGLM